jgi:hypothetical protein
MTTLPETTLPETTLAHLRHLAAAGQYDAKALLHLLDRADKGDQDVAKFVDSYSRTIAALCRRLEALERGANDLPALATPTPRPNALAGVVGNELPLLPDGRVDEARTRALIHKVAAWLDTQGDHGSANCLRCHIDR